MTVMRARLHHASHREAAQVFSSLDTPTIPLLDSSCLPAEEDWSVVGHARAYHDTHTDSDACEADDFDFAIEQGGLE